MIKGIFKVSDWLIGQTLKEALLNIFDYGNQMVV